MNKQLWQLLLITMLGKNAVRPLATAFMKLIGAPLCALAAGLLTARLLGSPPLPKNLPGAWLMGVAGMCGFIVGGFMLLALHTSRAAKNRISRTMAIISLLPVKKSVPWLFGTLPQMFVLVVLYTFLAVLAIALSHAVEFPTIHILMALFMGLGASLGYICLSKESWTVLRVAGFAAIVFIATKLMELPITNQASNQGLATVYVLFAVFIGLLIGIARGSTPHLHNGSSTAHVIGFSDTLIKRGWFVAKVARNHRLQTSFIFCLALAVITAIAVHYRNLLHGSGVGWLLFGGVLTAAYASDVRGALRRYKPPEITSLKGVGYFLKHEYAASVFAGLVLGLPMFLAAVQASGVSLVQLVAATVGIQLFAVAAGVLAGTIYVPEPGDIGSQLFAALTSMSFLFVFLRYSKAATFDSAGQLATWLAGAGICLIVTHGIESLRRKKYANA